MITGFVCCGKFPYTLEIEYKIYPNNTITLKYPADWKLKEGGFGVIVAFEGPDGIEASVRAIHDKSEFTKVGKEDLDSTEKRGQANNNRTVSKSLQLIENKGVL